MNLFGLTREYYSTELPSHDPDEHTTLHDVYDSSAAPPLPLNLGPYPNISSFYLGDWYWNHGVQKSQKNFKDLISIISAPSFNAEDIRQTQWSHIDKCLGGNDFEEDVGNEWEWEDVSAGWRKTQISIDVPFNSTTMTPGSKSEPVGDLYHRSIVSVIREKLADPSHDEAFHYEPYRLTWSPRVGTEGIRVHGELYTSTSFQEAHYRLQNAKGEPGCNLQRVVVALMFWSDATHLTAFGGAQLWPMYLFFGNESKYRRCKPSSHSCSHIAYFQTVSQNVPLI